MTSDEEPIEHVIPETIPTTELLDELVRRFTSEKRAFVIGYELKTQDGQDTTNIQVGGCGNNSIRFYLAHCVLDWCKKRAGIGFKDEDD